jgi:hypothetical protein
MSIASPSGSIHPYFLIHPFRLSTKPIKREAKMGGLKEVCLETGKDTARRL